MLTAKDVKEYAMKCGADKVGIASMDRFEGAPVDMHPATIFPETKSVIVFIMRILRGSLRGVEEGTCWNTYSFFGYAGLGSFLGSASRKLQRFIERQGWEAVPVMAKAALSEWGPTRDPVAPGKLPSDCVPSFRFAAVAAGLGELGHSKLLLTPQFGPRQRIAMILTDAPLEHDPLFKREICDHCMRCVVECPAQAIGGETDTVEINIAGKPLKWGRIDTGKCKLTHFGFNRKNSPFVAKDLPGLHFDVAKQTMTWKEAHDFGWGLAGRVRYISLIAHNYGSYWPICGARGCMRACVAHLDEKKGILNNEFKNPYRKRRPWLLSSPS